MGYLRSFLVGLSGSAFEVLHIGSWLPARFRERMNEYGPGDW